MNWQDDIDEAMAALDYNHLPAHLAMISQKYQSIALDLILVTGPSAETYRAIVALRTARDIHVTKVATGR